MRQKFTWSQWRDRAVVSKSAFCHRLARGWSQEESALTPSKAQRTARRESPFRAIPKGKVRSFQAFAEDDAALEREIEASGLTIRDFLAQLVHEYLQPK
ncbi:MAG: hypothetical protein J7641_19195 [Cyanobacteria bacterium SID2]|nr:hypothetical protein [Cyanobacteria bacterium SID2]MBP0004026.1 hypothetical protein [Cyanobacteria bacterium SBC]